MNFTSTVERLLQYPVSVRRAAIAFAMVGLLGVALYDSVSGKFPWTLLVVFPLGSVIGLLSGAPGLAENKLDDIQRNLMLRAYRYAFFVGMPLMFIGTLIAADRSAVSSNAVDMFVFWLVTFTFLPWACLAWIQPTIIDSEDDAAELEAAA